MPSSPVAENNTSVRIFIGVVSLLARRARFMNCSARLRKSMSSPVAAPATRKESAKPSISLISQTSYAKLRTLRHSSRFGGLWSACESGRGTITPIQLTENATLQAVRGITIPVGRIMRLNRSNRLVPHRLSYNLGTIGGGDTADPWLSSVWSAAQA